MGESRSDAIRSVANKMVPEHLRKVRRNLLGLDGAKAGKYKQEFFWKAFKALEFNEISGDYVEFGSHGGITFRLAYDQMRKRRDDRHMWAFDSFAGLPEWASEADAHPKWNAGGMATAIDKFHGICDSHGIASTCYTAVPGFFDETLNEPNVDRPSDIALAYIDCDLYSSTATVLEFLRPLFKPGMLLAFDDYHCWSAEGISGERRALRELAAATTEWEFAPYQDYGWAGRCYVVEPVG